MDRTRRLARILERRQPDRVAASPFPVSDDMMRYVEEGVNRLRSVLSYIKDSRDDRHYKMIDEATSEMGQILYKRSVSGPYDLDLVVYFYLQCDTWAQNITGSYIPRKSPGDPHVIKIEVPLFGGFFEHVDELNWRQIRETILHELIHVFHIEMLRVKGVKLPYTFHYSGNEPEIHEKYALQNQEMTAYEGSLWSEIEQRKRDGLSRKDAIRWAREKLKADAPKSGYERYVFRYPQKVKNYMTRVMKIIDRVYGE